ncbi:response regulator transcription factor [Cohnella nanjingensis]|uniref:Response regulator transcription factor n=1 Tax=Cohnella nanjingensis TaxID=1387779 RepID=A0A7X0RL89_9BACL|nr:response regulator transcription factor [Cohnella nanjingensis]MBB6669515.1 response regulator transcription factor [Cohnella nanjingensis]
MEKTILHIEDDQEIGSWVREFLEESGYRVIWIPSGYEAMNHMDLADLVLLDVMLPGLDGYTVGQRIKQKYPNKPILMLTARTSMEDKLHGLSFADDYMTKPYHPDELAARIQVLLRRFGTDSQDRIQLHHLSVYLKENRIVHSESQEEIVLTGKQYHIFMYFLLHPNQILTKKQLYEAIWGEPYLEGDKTLMVHIRHLREKIELDAGDPKIIETIRGVGYRVRQ